MSRQDGAEANSSTEETGGPERSTLFKVAAVCTIVGTLLGFWGARDAGRPEATADVKVREAFTGSWREVEDAKPGAMLEYRVLARNIGQIEISNVVVTISIARSIGVLSRSCSYDDGSSRGRCPRGWTVTGIPWASLSPGATLTIRVQARLRLRAPQGFQPVRVMVDSEETDPKFDLARLEPLTTLAEAAVANLFREVTSRPYVPWQEEPEIATRSERLLIRYWPRLRPDRVHGLDSIGGGRMVSIEELVHDHRLDGRIVTVGGTIHGNPTTYPRQHASGGEPGLVQQHFQLLSDAGRELAWCVTARRAGQLLHEGDRVLVRALGIAWGPAVLDRRSVPTVSLACAAVRRLPDVENAAAPATEGVASPNGCALSYSSPALYLAR